MHASVLHALLARIRFPDMALVRQRIENETLDDVPRAVAEEAVRIGLERRVRPGQSVAIAVGSRGIDRLSQVTRSLCDLFRGLKARPFIVSAMGSHGGATPEGQTRVLADLGISEQTTDAPLRIGLRTVSLGASGLGMPVLVDSLAAGADHLVVVNRIKAHTKFKALVESGLMKMLAVGLGNDEGARLLHGLAPAHGMYALIDAAARVILERGNLLCGVGLVENGLGRLHTLRLLSPNEIPEQEPLLLTLAKRLAPKLPFDDLDVLVVDEIGKDVSGTGMDTNVTGRNRDILGDFTSTPRIKRIFVRDLSPGTAGNALGIGFADVTTDRVARAIDHEKTVINALTGLSPEKAALPLYLPTDRLALAATIHTLGAVSPEQLRMVRIKNTKHLERLLVSPALLDDSTTSLRILHSPQGMDFFGDNLAPFPEPNG
jgi:hypothetical protein